MSMEYNTVVIDYEFDIGNMADYVFGVREDFTQKLRNMKDELEQKYNCRLYFSECTTPSVYWSFNNLDETLSWLEQLFLNSF